MIKLLKEAKNNTLELTFLLPLFYGTLIDH